MRIDKFPLMALVSWLGERPSDELAACHFLTRPGPGARAVAMVALRDESWCVGLTLVPNDDGDAWNVAEFVALPPSPIESAQPLRALPFGGLLTRARTLVAEARTLVADAQTRSDLRPTETPLGRVLVMPERPQPTVPDLDYEKLLHPFLMEYERGGVRRHDREYARLAWVYVDLLSRGYAPARELSKRYGGSPSLWGNRFNQARARGLLTRSERGKASGALTAQALTLLNLDLAGL